MAIYRWLRYELAPKLPVAYQTQLQRAASSAEFLQVLERILGNARSAIDGACDRLDKLPSFKNNRATDTLEFFNQLRAIWLDLNYLDEAFPDPQQPPSSAILCTCNMKKLRGKLNHDVDAQLVNFILIEGKYC